MRTLKSIFFICLFLLAITITSFKYGTDDNSETKKSWTVEDETLVKSAITNYVEGLYLADSKRIEKSVDSTMRKIGYWYNPKEKAYRDNLPMTYNQLVKLAATWNKSGKRANENTVKKIEIYDVNTKTASAKLTAAWGVDYFHLSKVNNQWKIMNVIWQSISEIEK